MVITTEASESLSRTSVIVSPLCMRLNMDQDGKRIGWRKIFKKQLEKMGTSERQGQLEWVDSKKIQCSTLRPVSFLYLLENLTLSTLHLSINLHIS